MLVGASLSISGCTYQALFKNALASPDLLGVTAGAAFGASLALLLNLGNVAVPVLAFLFGILAVIITFTLAKFTSRRGNITLALILIGMVIGALFSAGLLVIQIASVDPVRWQRTFSSG
jgi:iron complex transport system permease protein